MQRLFSSFVLTGLLTLVGCSSDDNNTVPAPVDMSQIRVIHASADAPMVNITANNQTLLSDVDYAISSGLLSINSDNYEITVDAQLPNGETTTVLTTDLVAEKDTE